MRILHTMLRVGDLERSIRFYTEVLGMRLLRRKDYPEGSNSLVEISPRLCSTFHYGELGKPR